MSNEMKPKSRVPTKEAKISKHKSKSEKSQGSSSGHGQKKRKRDHGEERHHSKSKKRKTQSDGNPLQSQLSEQNSPSQITEPKKQKLKSAARTTSSSPDSEGKVEPEKSPKSSPQKSGMSQVKKHRGIRSMDTEQGDARASFALPRSPISPFHIQTFSLYLPLAPISQNYPLEGICAEHISPLLLTYYPPFEGVLLSYSKPRLSGKPFGDDGKVTLLQSIDDYAASWTWLTAEFVIFKPDKGVWLEGHVNLQNEGCLGLICWNLFNASIERKRLPGDWKWRSAEQLVPGGDDFNEEQASSGYYVDGRGIKVEGVLRFRVRNVESSHDRERGFLSIEGTMLGDKEEARLYIEDGSRDTMQTKRRSNSARALGATPLGLSVEQDQ